MAEAFGLAVNVATVIDLFVKIGVQCSEYCANVKSAPRDIRALLNEADRFGATLRDIERLLNGPNGAKVEGSQSLRSAIEDCRLLLHNLATKLEQGTKRARLIWPLKKHDVADAIAKLERHRAAIAAELQIHQIKILRTIHQEVILQQLRTVERAGFDAHTDSDNATCLPGTRTNILRQISEWHNAPDSKSIFWLNGMAGTGKSTISRTIAKALSGKGMLGASFFFKRGEGDCGRANFFFPTIAAQLIRQIPSLAQYVRDEVEADPSIHTKSINEQFTKLLANPIEQLSLEPNQLPTVIVVDALDECENPNDVRLMLRLMAQTNVFTSCRLKFLITSRPELPIQLGFTDIHGQYDGLILQEIPRPDIHHDIALFMQHELAKTRQDWNNNARPDRQLSPNWPDADIQKLIDMAIPLFIFAATVCRYLNDRRLGSPQDQLRKVLQHQGSHNSNLDRTYLPVLDQLSIGLSGSEKEEVVQRFRKIIGSIVILASPLSISALAQLLDIPRSTIEDQLDLLHSVLSIPPDSDTPIRLLHLSFRDFLIDPEKRSLTAFWVDEKRVHQDTVANCIRIMKANLRKDICDLQMPGITRSDIDQQIITGCIPPELEYACLYWVDHLRQGDIYISDNELHLFLSSNLMYWLEALSLIGRALESIKMLRALRTLLKSSDCLELLTLIDDAIRFSLAYVSIIDTHPLQIYSLIAFIPKRVYMRSLFLSQQPAWLSIDWSLEQNWDSCLQTLEGHGSSVTSIVFSPDGKHLASASYDSTIRLWDAETGQCLQTLEGHGDSVASVAYSPKGEYLASCSADGTACLWDAKAGQCLRIFEGHGGSVKGVTFAPDREYLASASDDTTVRLWDVETGQCLRVFEGQSAYMHSVVFSPDGEYLASASNDTTVRLWDIETGQCLRVFAGHNYPVDTIIFSPDGKYLASASKDSTIQLWDTMIYQNSLMLQYRNGWIESVVFSPDRKYLATVSKDTTIRLWDAETGKYLQKFEVVCFWVSLVVFSLDTKRLASASHDGTIRLWDIETGQCLQIFDDHHEEEAANSVIFSTDRKYLASASASSSYDNTIRLWDTETGHWLRTLGGHRSWVNSLAFSLDTERLASASHDETIRLWDIGTGQCLQILEDHGNSVSSVVFSPDSKYLASASKDLSIHLWDTETGQCLQILVLDKEASQVSFTPDGSHLQTDYGIITIDHTKSSCPPTVLVPEFSYPISLPDGLDWITWNGYKVMWLPTRFRPLFPGSVALLESKFVIGSRSGTITLVQIEVNELPDRIRGSAAWA